MPNRLKYTFLALVVISISVSGFLPRKVFASGACCAITQGEKSRPHISLAGSYGSSHEKIGGEQFNLGQSALLLKYGYSLFEKCTIQANIGLPVSTKLNDSNGFRGSGGIIYGAGIGYELPKFIEPINSYFLVSYSMSYGLLQKTENEKGRDSVFIISEIQSALIIETKVADKFGIYGGLRAYSGKNRLKNSITNEKVDGEREGNYSPLFGGRYNISDKISAVAESGLGHNRVTSSGLIYYF
ncbi:MAG: hypothetical protein AB1498_04405 [bacterium]